ncbi:hypothetical protein NL676_033773 [Syzygium grande]|nr:hypothetical protein NL676_033773 [Syzygium grande]
MSRMYQTKANLVMQDADQLLDAVVLRWQEKENAGDAVSVELGRKKRRRWLRAEGWFSIDMGGLLAGERAPAARCGFEQNHGGGVTTHGHSVRP